MGRKSHKTCRHFTHTTRGRAPIETNAGTGPVNGNGKCKDVSHLAEYQWKPGESGNPAGRPRVDLKPEIRAFADEVDPKTGKTRFRVWLEICDRRARQGSAKHLETLLDRGWGKPLQGVELDANLSYTDALTKAKERMRKVREAEEADRTIRQYFNTPGLPAPTNGHSTPEEAQAAASLPDQDLSTAREDDAERLAPAPAKQKITVEL